VPETKKKMPLLGREVEVADVPAKHSTELFNEYELEDGSVLKVKSVATNFLRIEGEYLPDGRPVYIVLVSPVVNVESSPLAKRPTS
jgi:hypothetical protein